MKKIHRKIINQQASYFDKLVRDIKSYKKGKKMRGGGPYSWVYVSGKNKKEIIANNSKHYTPLAVKGKVTNKNIYQKATLMRFIISFLKKEQLIYSSVYFRKKGFYQRRINGNIYLIKRKLCDKLFGKE